MNLNELHRLGDLVERLSEELGCSTEEIIECFECRLISEEDAGDLREYFK